MFRMPGDFAESSVEEIIVEPYLRFKVVEVRLK
jgi:hypothetical protein